MIILRNCKNVVAALWFLLSERPNFNLFSENYSNKNKRLLKFHDFLKRLESTQIFKKAKIY